MNQIQRGHQRPDDTEVDLLSLTAFPLIDKLIVGNKDTYDPDC